MGRQLGVLFTPWNLGCLLFIRPNLPPVGAGHYVAGWRGTSGLERPCVRVALNVEGLDGVTWGSVWVKKRRDLVPWADRAGLTGDKENRSLQSTVTGACGLPDGGMGSREEQQVLLEPLATRESHATCFPPRLPAHIFALSASGAPGASLTRNWAAQRA